MACTIDFRCLDEGLGGKTYKRKREALNSVNTSAEDAETSMEIDEAYQHPAKRSAVPSSEDPDKPKPNAIFGRPTYDGVIAGKVSGRKWKQPRRQRASASLVSHKGTSFEERARQKKIKAAFRERKEELKEQIRSHKVEKRKIKAEREKKKQENILKHGTKLQKITNPKTLKKVAKSKQKKQLKVVPDNYFKK